MIYLIGSKGNMGRRYASILNYLDRRFVGIDVHNMKEMNEAMKNFPPSHLIIATPTEKHIDALLYYDHYDAKILCEKPIIKRKEDLSLLLEVKSKFYMVNNYEYIPSISDNGTMETSYNFFNSGKDGLIFDCSQIIRLAKKGFTLKRHSPIWEVRINGEKLAVDGINESYILMITDFLNDQMFLQDKEDIYNFHKKLIRINEDYEREGNKDFYRSASKI